MVWFASFVYGVSGFFLQRYFPLVTIVFSLLLLLSLRTMGWRGQALVVVISLCGFLYAQHFVPPSCNPSLVAGKTMAIKAEPVSLARESSRSVFFSQTVKVIAPKDGPAEMRLVAPFPLSPGKAYSIIVSLSVDTARANPGSSGGAPVAYLRDLRKAEEGESFPPWWLTKQRARLNSFLRERLSPETAPFIMAIVTGERGLIPQEMRDAFSSTGLAHILSISGTHFGLLLFVVFSSARAAVRRLPYAVLVRLTTWATPDQCAAVITIPFMVSYLGLSSLSVPALRAFIMVSLFLTGLLVQRKGFWLNTLLFAAAVILCISPESVLDLSFQLSFVSVLAIGMVSQRWLKKEPLSNGEGDEPPRSKPVLSYLRASFIISLAATIATAPLVACRFHYLSLVSPLANLIFAPLIGFVILPVALFSSFFYLLFEVFPFLPLLDMTTRFLLSAITWLSHWKWAAMDIPAYPAVVVMAFYAGMAVYVYMNYRAPGERKGLLSPFLPVAVSVVPVLVYLSLTLLQEKGMTVTYLDVGQGDAAVVELPDGRTVVVDAGRKGREVASFLRYRGISEVEAIALSHGQLDHAGGLQRLLQEFKVREVWDNGRLVYPAWFLPEGTRQRQLQSGDLIEGPGYRITVLHPYDGFYTRDGSEDSENNDSLVLRIEGKKNAFLFTGDIEEAAEENLACLGGYLQSEILKTPHHGSRTSASESFISTVSPSIAVISVGNNNPYGHPHQETLNLLSSSTVLRTDRSGAVGIREQPDGRLAIQQWREFALCDATTPADEWLNIKKLFWVW